eukprot:1158307-Pelagomonas_calceolata.AAC.10
MVSGAPRGTSLVPSLNLTTTSIWTFILHSECNRVSFVPLVRPQIIMLRAHKGHAKEQNNFAQPVHDWNRQGRACVGWPMSYTYATIITFSLQKCGKVRHLYTGPANPIIMLWGMPGGKAAHTACPPALRQGVSAPAAPLAFNVRTVKNTLPMCSAEAHP